MVEKVRLTRLVGWAKCTIKGERVPCSVYEAQWGLTCTRCGYSIQPGTRFTRQPKTRGAVPTEPVCRHCLPFTDLKA